MISPFYFKTFSKFPIKFEHVTVKASNTTQKRTNLSMGRWSFFRYVKKGGRCTIYL